MAWPVLSVERDGGFCFSLWIVGRRKVCLPRAKSTFDLIGDVKANDFLEPSNRARRSKTRNALGSAPDTE